MELEQSETCDVLGRSFEIGTIIAVINSIYSHSIAIVTAINGYLLTVKYFDALDNLKETEHIITDSILNCIILETPEVYKEIISKVKNGE